MQISRFKTFIQLINLKKNHETLCNMAISNMQLQFSAVSLQQTLVYLTAEGAKLDVRQLLSNSFFKYPEILLVTNKMTNTLNLYLQEL